MLVLYLGSVIGILTHRKFAGDVEGLLHMFHVNAVKTVVIFLLSAS
jgi:hypothetical protein